MAVLNKDDFMNKIKTLIGDNTDEEHIKALEDFTDTYNDFENRSKDDYKSKYDDEVKKHNEDVEAWKQRYINRFYDNSADDSNASGGTDTGASADSNITIDDLFR